MRTTGARLAYFVGYPIQYLLLFACIADHFPYATKSILFAIFLAWHIASPLAIWAYEASYNPYAFAPAMRGRAGRAEQLELLEANRRLVKWYLDQGPLTADLRHRPVGIGFCES